jgi:MFS family permease
MNTVSLAPPTTTTDRRRWLALGVVCLAQLMIVLDTTIVNVALPSIQRDLHFSQGNLTWVVNAFLITFGSFLLLAGRLGDLFARASSSPGSPCSPPLRRSAAWPPARAG